MEFDHEVEYARDYPYGDEEITEQDVTDEEDNHWPQFCEGCGFAVLDGVCEDDGECPTCGDDIVDCACTLGTTRVVFRVPISNSRAARKY